MATSNDRRTVERTRFFEGQRLVASDLNDVVADHRWRRQLHNASLHQPGIGNGFPVIGSPGDREVTIGPGYALDVFGREIISTRSRVEPVPPVAGDPSGGAAFYDLVVSYPDDEFLEEAETRHGVCEDASAVRLSEETVLCWVPLEEDSGGDLHPVDPDLSRAIAAGERIRLARARVRRCRLEELSFAERRDAKPPAQPTIACGLSTVAWRVEPIPEIGFMFSVGFTGTWFSLLHSTGHRMITLDDSDDTSSSGEGGEFEGEAAASVSALPIAESGAAPSFFLVADVSTASGGFRSTPCYSAGLRGERKIVVPIPDDEENLEIFADGVVSIENPSSTGFTVRVLPLLLANEELLSKLHTVDFEIPWKVQWMGVGS